MDCNIVEENGKGINAFIERYSPLIVTSAGRYSRILSKSLPVEVHNLTFELHLPVEELNLIVESKSLPVEVSNSTTEFHLPVDSQYSLPVVALHLIVESKSLPVEVNNSTIELHLPVKAKEKLPIIYSK